MRGPVPCPASEPELSARVRRSASWLNVSWLNLHSCPESELLSERADRLRARSARGRPRIARATRTGCRTSPVPHRAARLLLPSVFRSGSAAVYRPIFQVDGDGRKVSALHPRRSRIAASTARRTASAISRAPAPGRRRMLSAGSSRRADGPRCAATAASKPASPSRKPWTASADAAAAVPS